MRAARRPHFALHAQRLGRHGARSRSTRRPTEQFAQLRATAACGAGARRGVDVPPLRHPRRRPTCRWASACRPAPRWKSPRCAPARSCWRCTLDDVRDRAAGAAGRDRVRRRALRHHGPDGVQPRRRPRARCSSTRARSSAAFVPLPAGSAVLVLDSGVAALARGQRLQPAARANARRRRALLGVRVAARRGRRRARCERCRDRSPRRARHVVTENARVLQARGAARGASDSAS